MSKLLLLITTIVITLAFSGCTGVIPGGTMPNMDHSTTATGTPMADMNSSRVLTNTQTSGMEHSSMMTGTEVITKTQMADMDPAKPFDAQFIDGMIAHHQGAIKMAKQALEQAEHEELRTLAENIIAAQTQESEEMMAWRQSWYPDLPPTGGMSMNMGDMAIDTDTIKPFDQAFIEAMISHHQGAIEMAKMAQHMAEHEEIKHLADAIITAQQAEIEQLQGWLQAWYNVSQ